MDPVALTIFMWGLIQSCWPPRVHFKVHHITIANNAWNPWHPQTGEGRITTLTYDVAKGPIYETWDIPCPTDAPQGGYSVFRAAPLLYIILNNVGPFSALHLKGATRSQSHIQNSLRITLCLRHIEFSSPEALLFARGRGWKHAVLTSIFILCTYQSAGTFIIETPSLNQL